jgi:hypothetical protein
MTKVDFWKNKKILFINSYKPDYLQDIVYQGLVQILGKKVVFDYPFNINFHVPLRKYPRNLAYNKGIPILNFSLDFKTFDAVILGSAKPDVFETYLKILHKIPDSTPVVFVDGGDFEAIGGDLTRLNRSELYNSAIARRQFDLIFKREYMQNTQYENNVFPLPFASYTPGFTMNTSQKFAYDVSFWAVESHPVRTKVLHLLENSFDCKQNGTEPSQVFAKYKRKGLRYLEELAACKVVLNFRGAGWDTLRYWEVPLMSRSLLVSQNPQIVIPNNLVDKEEIIYVKDDLTDLLDVCQYYLDHENQRNEIVQQAAVKIQKYHLPIHRATIVMSELEKLVGK